MYTNQRYGIGGAWDMGDVYSPEKICGVAYAKNPSLAWDEDQDLMTDSAGNNGAAGGLINPVELSLWYDFTENTCTLKNYRNVEAAYNVGEPAWNSTSAVNNLFMACQRHFLCYPLTSAIERNCGYDPSGTTTLGCFGPPSGSQVVYKKADRIVRIYNKATRAPSNSNALLGGAYQGGGVPNGYTVGANPAGLIGVCLTEYVTMPIGFFSSTDYVNLDEEMRPVMEWIDMGGSGTVYWNDNQRWCKSGGGANFKRRTAPNWGIGSPWNDDAGDHYYPFMYATSGRQQILSGGSVVTGDPFTQYQSCIPAGYTGNTLSITGGGTNISKRNILGHNLNMRDFTCAIVFTPLAATDPDQSTSGDQAVLSLQGTYSSGSGSFNLLRYDIGYHFWGAAGGSGWIPKAHLEYGTADGSWSVTSSYNHMLPNSQTDANGASVDVTLSTTQRNIVIHRVWAKDGPGSAELYISKFGNICDTVNGTEIYGVAGSRPQNVAIGGTLPGFDNINGLDPIMYMNIPGNVWNSVRLGCGHGTPDGNDEDDGWRGEEKHFNGTIYEIIFYRGALNETGVSLLEAYLKKKHHSYPTHSPHDYATEGASLSFETPDTGG